MFNGLDTHFQGPDESKFVQLISIVDSLKITGYMVGYKY